MGTQAVGRMGTLLGALAALAALALLPAAPGPLVIPDGEDPGRWTEELDRLVQSTPDAPRPLVFLGSSSIRRWSTLAADMAPLPVLNRGFGGSRIFDAVHWFDRLVTPHDPSVIVVFSGTNDLSGSNPRQPSWILEQFDQLVRVARRSCRTTPLVYIAISPSPSRIEHLDAVLETNRLIAERCAADPLLEFVDTATGLLDAEGRPDPSWFVEDRLHLNAEGYQHWTRVLKPVLERLDSVPRS
jgi:lysophospholipase L1-like esterase